MSDIFEDLAADVQTAQDEAAAAPAEQPAPSAPVAPENKAPAADPKATEKHDARTVPLATLIEERNAARELRERLHRMEATWERLQKLATEPEPAPKAAVPEFDADPAEHLKHGVEQTQKSVDQLRAEQQQMQQAFQYEAFRSGYNSDFQAFKAQTPDYEAAALYVQKAREAELELLGVADPAQRAQSARQEWMQTAAAALARGQSPAALLYQYAQLRGYKPASASAAPANAAKLEAIAAGQAKAKSLSGAGGAAETGAVSLEALANMDDEEFAAATQGANWRRLLRQAS